MHYKVLWHCPMCGTWRELPAMWVHLDAVHGWNREAWERNQQGGFWKPRAIQVTATGQKGGAGAGPVLSGSTDGDAQTPVGVRPRNVGGQQRG